MLTRASIIHGAMKEAGFRTPTWPEVCIGFLDEVLEGGQYHDLMLQSLSAVHPERRAASFTLLAALTASRGWAVSSKRNEFLDHLQQGVSLCRGHSPGHRPVQGRHGREMHDMLSSINFKAIMRFEMRMVGGYLDRLEIQGISKPDWTPMADYLFEVFQLRLNTTPKDREKGVAIPDKPGQVYKNLFQRYSRLDREFTIPSDLSDCVRPLFDKVHATLEPHYPA